MTKAEKEAFKKRMAAGRKKAAKAQGAKTPKAKKRKPATKKAAKKSNPNARKTKKVIGKGFGRALAAEHIRGKKKAAKAKTAAKKHTHSQRRNSESSATHLYEEFHQKAPGRVREYTQELRYPKHFAELGKLIELRFFLNDANPDFSLTKFGECQVVSTPDGSNIYFIGGDQSLDLAALDIGSDKDFVALGPCTYISYHTIKGFHDFAETTYWHLFGEEDGIFPELVYDRLNKGLFLTSGNYRVRPEGIVN